MDNKVLIVLGAGRSGTSFLASWLHNCGLNIGINLVESDWVNSKGYFEDKEIMDFQHAIYIREKKHTAKIAFEDQLFVKEEDFQKAINIVQNRNNKFIQWGWKDIRTNLLIHSLWSNLLPNAKCILIYRDYENVVDSYLRIKRSMLRKNKLFALIKQVNYKFGIQNMKENNAFLTGWIKHNEEALAYLKNNKQQKDFMVVTVENLLEQPKQIFQNLTEVMDFKLNYVDPIKIYDKKIFQHSKKNRYVFDTDLKDRAELLLQELDAINFRNITAENL